MITLIVCAVIILAIVFLYTGLGENVYIRSDVDNRVYLIRRGTQLSESALKESANTLAEINKRVTTLIQILESKYSNDINKAYFIKMLHKNYKPEVLSEAAVDKRYTTYTIDKTDMHICLRTRDKQENIYDINLLMYVVLHELAHLCNYNKAGNPIHGHGQEFKNIFKLLVKESISAGIYQYQNYQTKPQEYCGIVINSTII
jgi:hypothetical protein